MATVIKNSKTYKIDIFSQTARYIWLKFCMEYKEDLIIHWHENEKKTYIKIML